MNALWACEKNTKSLKEFKADPLLREKNYSVLYPTLLFHELYLHLLLLQLIFIQRASLKTPLYHSFEDSRARKSIILQVCCMFLCFTLSCDSSLWVLLTLPFFYGHRSLSATAAGRDTRGTKRRCVILDIQLIQGHTKTFGAGNWQASP